MLKLKQSAQQAATLSLLVSLVFGSLAPAFSMPVFALEQISNEKPAPQISTGQTDLSQIDLLEKPLEAVPEPIIQPIDIGQINPVEINPEEIVPKEDLLPPDDANRDGEEPEPYIQKDEIKSLTDKLNINTDTNTGAFNYTYPIEIPAGRNNLQPDLALSYNNQDTNNQNLFGYSWSLNIPSIERLNKTGIDNLYTDNYFSSSLGGELAPISLSDNIHGTYGPRVENGDFLKYEYTTSSTWIITDKMGTVYTFGKIQADRQDNPNDNTKIYKWMLSEVRDTNDNFIRYQYYKDAGQIYPEKIFYTGHGETDGVFEIEFVREERSDNLGSFQTGFSVTNNYRFSQILVKIDAQWQKKYYLNYETGDNGNRSLLSGVQEAAPSPDQEVEAAMPEDEFDYQVAGQGFVLNEDWEINFPQIDSEDSTFHFKGDVNGDGLLDLLYSIPDHLDEQGQGHDGINKVMLNNGHGWEEASEWSIPVYLYDRHNDYTGAEVLDLNGDGLVDIFYTHELTYGSIKRVYINNGTGWTLEQNWEPPVYCFSEQVEREMGCYLADINGDGLPDLLKKRSQPTEEGVYINNGTGWIQNYTYNIPVIFSTYYDMDPSVRVVDINGDGLVDILRSYYWNSNNSHNYVYINNGHDWALDASWVLPVAFANSHGRNSGAQLVDFNNDHLLDIIGGVDLENGLSICKTVQFSSGNGIWHSANLFNSIPFCITNIYGDGLSGTYFNDINGDGFTDLYTNGFYINYLYKNQVVKNIKIANGAQINIDYQASAQYTEPDDQVSMSSARDVEVLLPETAFDYPNDLEPAWTDIENLDLPDFLKTEAYNGPSFYNDNGVRFGDVNGDGLADMLHSHIRMTHWAGDIITKNVYINQGNNTWEIDENYYIPVYFSRVNEIGDGGFVEDGARLSDVNGDGLVDIIEARTEPDNTDVKHVYINKGDGTGWEEDLGYNLPTTFVKRIAIDGRSLYYDARLSDVNGDGLEDILVSYRHYTWYYTDNFVETKHVYINKGDGTGWEEDVNYVIPVPFMYKNLPVLGAGANATLDTGVRLSDINGDGLVDIMESRYERIGYYYPSPGWTRYINNVYINKGDGTGWEEIDDYVVPDVFVELRESGRYFSNEDRFVRLMDINGDHLDDLVKSRYMDYNNEVNIDQGVWINKGDSTGWHSDSDEDLPFYFSILDPHHEGSELGEFDNGCQFNDINGDATVDVVCSRPARGNPMDVHDIYINNHSNKILTNINDSDGSQINLNYQASAQYTEPGEQVSMSSERDVEVLLPEEEFEYEDAEMGWLLDESFELPLSFASNYPTNDHQFGVALIDINGDSLIDLVQKAKISGYSTIYEGVYINNGHGWSQDFDWEVPVFIEIFDTGINSMEDTGVRFADVNGDNLVDIIRALDASRDVYINTGYSWVLDENFYFPVRLGSAYSRQIIGVELVDVNSDNLVDIVQNGQDCQGQIYNNVYINTGYSWVLDENWHVPEFISYCQDDNNTVFQDMGVRFADINVDGLVDLVRGYEQGTVVYMNNGQGWVIDLNWVLPESFAYGRLGNVLGTMFIDVNGDNLPDIVRNNNAEYDPNFSSGNFVYLNSGNNWFLQANLFFPLSVHGAADEGVRLADVNGDGLVDAIKGFGADRSVYLNVYLNKDLSNIETDNLIKISSNYQASSQSRDVGDELANPKLPYIIQTVKQINVFDGVATTTIDYQYSGGEQYFDAEHPRDKKFAGFAKVEKTIGDKTTKTYYQQANETNGDGGESTDTYAKIGKVYRQEVYEAEDLKSASIQKWQEEDLSTNRGLVYSPEKSQMDFASSTVMTSAQYDYDLTNGNLLAENNLGQVELNTNTGEILDTLVGDEKTTTYEYATNEVKHILSAPKEKVISDTIDTKSQELYYDDLAFGQVNKVNLTKEDYLVDNVEINWEFNDLGLVVAETDPENNVSEIVYDENNLYPSETTNALGQTNLTEYNLLNGQIDRSVAPNGAITENQYDAFGRLIKTWVSNNKSPNDLTLKQEISYDDYSFPRSKSVKDYFDVQRSYLIREYYDGLDRVIQTKKQLAEENSWSTQDTTYDVFGRVSRQSLPYISQSIDYSEPDLNQVAKTYTYDALDRVLTETTPVGTSTYEYNGFTTTIYDANNNRKDLVKDAYGNLVQVKEYNGQDVYTTNYEYSLTNKLTKIIDALGNVRNFVYDDLDNLVWQDMIQRPDVQNIQGITYSYDKNGNVLSQTNLNNQIITYTYDDLNRVLTESVNGGVKIRYTYDEGDYDAGQLTKVEYLDNGNWQEYDYDILGRQTAYRAKIGRQNYTLNQVNLLNGDVAYLKYPNEEYVYYVKNTVGQNLFVSFEGQILVDNLQYNVNGQLVHLERANGLVTNYSYTPEQAYRLTNLNTSNATSTLQNISYTYDAVGNILNITDNASTDLARSATYEYDDLNRLSSTTVSYLNIPNSNYSQSFSYDAIGNILSNSALGEYSYELANPQQLSSVGSQNFVYDNVGNLLTDSQKTLTWDWRSRLQKSQNFGTEDFTNYEYDHQNQRLAKITKTQRLDIEPDLEPIPIIAAAVSTPLPPPIDLPNEITLNEEHYVDQYFEKNLQTGDFKAHIFLNGQKIATINNNNAPYYIISDHLNSSSILVDDAGNIAEVSDYRPFGSEAYSNTIIDLDNDYNFTGKETDEESSLQYFGARYMDNNIGRFVSVDPAVLAFGDGKEFKDKYDRSLEFHLSNPQNLNAYSYVTNNPLRYTDPDGEIIPLLILGYVALEVGFSAWDAYDAGKAWFGEDSSNSDKAWATSGLVAGLVLPGGGYGRVAKVAAKQQDNVLRHVMFGSRKGGLHVLENAVSQGKKIENLQEVGKSGVMMGKIDGRFKTFFPSNWSTQDIKNSLSHLEKNQKMIERNGNVYIQSSKPYKGVYLEGTVNKGSITSFYPSQKLNK